ncbi:penicillin-binding protein 1B [Pseudomonas neustonica]|uniref:Penicillin-binding protein 1B n=1 Tax=Pseudomonas neustonica TaxID=2487346 RepID=A0ABX9XGK7_9PSED|nr:MULTISPECIES: penicillin-binding protein 1B [Pseudomonas]ROZ81846.1 penicillin-binding protein 1B [Pseudomonas sp. SSM44]ROZ83689.1 penicillin-binding protein 1B [Pseudomonas neustonica]|tara:strand:+ start:5328 stop:7655 length:2328 start_codon:yes stop_codon:yes gene_type:complete
MAKKRKVRSRNKVSMKRRLGGWILKLGLVFLVLFAALAMYLDAIVQEKFSGKRWSVPAKVFARPLELYAGQHLTRDDFLTELKALGYRSVNSVSGPGQMSVGASRIDVYTRGFQFFEGAEPAQRVSVRFNGQQVASISGSSDLVMARLEPMMIGGIYPAHNEDRILVRLDQASPYLVDSLVAVEDREFFQHFGVSPKGIARAIYVNLTSGSLRQGGSTLTQQLVKNFYLNSDRNIIRKGLEAMMSILLELHYSKEDILEAYLNEVFLGQDGNRAIHGFGLASQYYFAQPLQELQLHQVALLVGMVKGASYYNPRRNPERATNRRNLVLDLMAEQGIISAEQAVTAKNKPLDVSIGGSMADTSYPAFMDLVKRQLRADYRDEDLTSEGLRIFTSLDPLLQHKAEEAVKTTLKRIGPAAENVPLESAMVVTGAQTGEVMAVVGGSDPRFSGFNRALDASRPIGSLIKPAIYLTALEQADRYSLVTPIDDAPIELEAEPGKIWAPQNYGRQSHGLVPLYLALAKSYNQAAVRLGMDVGVDKVLNTVRRLGVEHDWPAYPSMLLGSGAMTPMQVSDMYQTLANGGFNTPLRSIRNVLTAQGEPLKRYPFEVRQRFDSASIFLTQEAMSHVMTEGTGRSAYNRVPASVRLAGKTGTTNDLRDSWFAGFSDDLVAVAWVGRDDNGRTRLTGATGALQVWSAFMGEAHPQSLSAVPPSGIVKAWADPATGLGSDPSCVGSIEIPFRQGYEPLPGPGCRPVIDTEALQDGANKVLDTIRGWLR